MQQYELTTFFTRVNDSLAAPLPALQSSGLYGASITTASDTTISFPSHLVGNVRLMRSNISCASRLTPLPLRASSALRRAIVLSRRDWRAEWSRGGSSGKEAVGAGRDTRLKDWRADIGRMWYVEASVAGVGDAVRVRRLSAGETVNSVPSIVRDVGGTVCRRILYLSVSREVKAPKRQSSARTSRQWQPSTPSPATPCPWVRYWALRRAPCLPCSGVYAGCPPSTRSLLRPTVSSCVKNRAFESVGGPVVGLRRLDCGIKVCKGMTRNRKRE